MTIPTHPLAFLLPGFTITDMQVDETHLTLSATATTLAANCPCCGSASTRVHSHYSRTPHDLPLVGFLPATDPRMRGTVRAVQDHLMRDGFVERYRTDPDVDGLPSCEGVFLVCTFWLAHNLALQGRHDEARTIFERLLGLCNDVGLLSEKYDSHTKRLVGNFPNRFRILG